MVTSAEHVAVNDSTNFTVLAGEGSDLQYRWSAVEGALPGKGPSVTQVFSSPGRKLVTVKVFNQVSSESVSKAISVQEVVTGVSFTSQNVTGQNYVATGVNVSFKGSVLTGTDVTWTWLLPGRTGTGRQTSHVFTSPRRTTVTLNATNDVSGQALSKDFLVQDRIHGLELIVSTKIAAVGERVEFTAAVATGTDVEFVLNISGNSTGVPLLNQAYVHRFSRVDSYNINLTAQNQVRLVLTQPGEANTTR